MHPTTPAPSAHHGSRLVAFGCWATVNYKCNCRTWIRSYEDAAPHARFWGYTAQLRSQLGGYFVNEPPDSSWLCAESPWAE
eukprot:5332394-Pyramimonas_sp.AAC.1